MNTVKTNENKKFGKNVYGVVGLVSRFANWNADFDKYPKRSQGQIYASDKALKFVIRRYLENKGKKVFYSKGFDKDSGKVLSYTGKYKAMFGDYKGESDRKVIKNLLSCKDIKFFGTVATLSEKNDSSSSSSSKGASKNIGIRGIVQFSHGFNLNDDVQVIREVITTQFSSGEGKDNSSLGDIILTDNAHYFYGFSINENNISNIREFLLSKPDNEEEENKKSKKNKKQNTLPLEDFNEEQNKQSEDYDVSELVSFTEEDYDLFKKSCLEAVDAYNSASKAGCYNHFAIFVETDEFTYMPNIVDYLKLETEYDENDNEFKVLNLEKFLDLINSYEDNIINVEIYFRPEYIKIREEDLNKLKEKDFITIKEF